MKATPKALAIRWFEEVWNQRRTETIHELFPAHGIGHLEGTEIQGPEQFLAIHSEFVTAFPDIRFTVDGIVSEGDSTTVRWTAQGTHSGKALGLEPTGRPVTIRGMTWLRFEDEVIVEGWDCWNQAGLIQSLRAPAN